MAREGRLGLPRKKCLYPAQRCVPPRKTRASPRRGHGPPTRRRNRCGPVWRGFLRRGHARGPTRSCVLPTQDCRLPTRHPPSQWGDAVYRWRRCSPSGNPARSPDWEATFPARRGPRFDAGLTATCDALQVHTLVVRVADQHEVPVDAGAGHEPSQREKQGIGAFRRSRSGRARFARRRDSTRRYSSGAMRRENS